MKFRPTRLALCLMSALAINTASAAEPAATVNGQEIPSERLEVMLAEQQRNPRAAQTDPEALRNAVREELIRREVLSQVATAEGYDKRSEVQAQMELARQAILIRAYLQEWAKNNSVSEADVRAEYDKQVAELKGTEYKSRHILVETEQEAKDIISKLNEGGDFAELASASKDPGSAARGGELGWARPAQFVPEFSNAMVKLAKGEYTKDPVQSSFGYHIIKMDDQRDAEPPPFEQIGPQIAQRLQQQRVEAHIIALRDKAKVK